MTGFAILGPVLNNLWLRRLITVGVLGGTLAVALTAGCLSWVRSSAAGHIYSAGEVPAAPIALVLGAQVDPGGQPSPFLAARLEAARQLYASGKVRAILVSGDHANWDYDEPGAMMVWLVSHGVPVSRVVLDHAGFDTYDSCARARRVFGVRTAVVVTQAFHIERAVAVCRALGIEATGVGDETVRSYRRVWLRGVIREEFAAVKAAGDVLSRRDPVRLGRRETGVADALR